jgi:tetratricopeptide (TPR) repeat protein
LSDVRKFVQLERGICKDLRSIDSLTTNSITLRCCASWILAAMALAFGAGAQASELRAGADLEVQAPADQPQEFTVTLSDGMAVDLEMTQLAGFVDLELRKEIGAPLKVRTESGLLGRIEATLLASQSRRWLIIVGPRKGKGAGTVRLRLSTLRRESDADRFKASAYEHYVEAEALRFANYRETKVIARSAEITAQTRGAYDLAEAQYAAATDGCGRRRALIGRARMEVALENYAQGKATAEAALTAACIDDPAEQAQALKTSGMAAAYLGDFNGSAEAAERALAIYRKTGDVRYQGIVLGNLSEVYMQLGATERALSAARGALQAADDTSDGQGIVFSRKSIADIHLARGELASALQEYRSTLTSLAATPYPMIEAETWDDLGIVYHRLGDYQESLRAYAMALSVWKKMARRGGEADTLINEAQTYLELRQSAAAEDAFATALEISRTDGLKSEETNALRGIGETHLAEGRLADARRDFLQSLALARATGEVGAQSYALRAIAEVNFRERAYAAARRNDEAALRLERAAADRDGEAATLAQLARVHAETGDLAGAKALLDQGIAIIEMQRGRIDDPSLRTSYFAAMRAYPDAQIDILMRLEAAHPDGRSALSALAASERARARTLQDMFAEKSLSVSGSLPPALADSLHAAEEKLRTAAFQLDRATASGTGNRASLSTAFDLASHELDEIRGRVRSANPRYADLVQPIVPKIDIMQQSLLDDDEAVLEYWLGSRASYVWILTRHSLRAFRLAPQTTIEQLGRKLSVLLSTSPEKLQTQGFEALAHADAGAVAGVHEAAARLATEIIGPQVFKGLPRRIAVIADGVLHSVPFGILPAEDGHPLGSAHEITYLPSITTLKWLRHSGSLHEPNASLAVFAAPIMDDSMTPLPYSISEAEQVAAFLPKDRVWLAVGAEASRANTLAADWGRFTIVHFATHAIVDVNRPEISGIVLSSRGPDGHREDAMLRVNDIYNLDMPVDLVVLSGCETAAGRGIGSEGVISLSRAFFYAGAERVLASLWPVDDRAAAALMPEFYRALLVDHQSAAAALRIAQQHLARDSRWAAPYYWAGFVLQGDWN